MDIETLGFLGFVFAVTSLGAMAYEHRADVLHGSYLDGCAGEDPINSARRLWTPSIMDRLRWKVRRIIQVAFMFAA
jgi:hypothetical protein